VAQRDAAQRALGLFIGLWGAHLVGISTSVASAGAANANECDTDELPHEITDISTIGAIDIIGHDELPEVRMVSSVCRQFGGDHRTQVAWNLQWDGTLCQAFVEPPLHGVRHQFGGPSCANLVEAYKEPARRVLWYLDSPGYEGAFTPDPDVLDSGANSLPPAPVHWMADASEVAVQDAEEKTTLMRLQNRLQRALATRLGPGERVWTWSYETCPEANIASMVKATVHIPMLGHGASFTSDRFLRLRSAQVELCGEVTRYLDAEGYP
jgi:hypothetical protein